MKTPTENFVSWDIAADPVFDAEGDEVGSDEYALIEKVYVCPTQRRQGLARKMLTDAIAEIKAAHSGMPIRIAALPFGDEAIEMADLVDFYESIGFDVVNTAGHAVILEL